METVVGVSPELTSQSEIVSFDDDDELITYTRNNKLPSSIHAVLSNDDLLIEILLRLPIIPLILNKQVSKQWLSIIKDAHFTLRRSQISNLAPAIGLFIKWQDQTIFSFLPLDIRVPFKRSLLHTAAVTIENEANVEILRSCNGLLLCWDGKDKYYVCNPTINICKMLREPLDFKLNPTICHVGINIAFDPTKSPHYKVVYVLNIRDQQFGFYDELHTYSSETDNWSFCSDRFPRYSFGGFDLAVYLNYSFHWIRRHEGSFHYKLDIVKHPVLTIIKTPQPLEGKVCWDHKFFESRGCLLLLCRVCMDHMHIYEMTNEYSEWSMKYIVNLKDIVIPYKPIMRVRSVVFCIVLGEREEDSFMAMEFKGKGVQYKFASKSLCSLSESLGNFKICVQFIPSFANV